MFTCDYHNGPSMSGEPCLQVVTKWRDKGYENKVNGETKISYGKEAEIVKKQCRQCFEKERKEKGEKLYPILSGLTSVVVSSHPDNA